MHAICHMPTFSEIICRAQSWLQKIVHLWYKLQSIASHFILISTLQVTAVVEAALVEAVEAEALEVVAMIKAHPHQ